MKFVAYLLFALICVNTTSCVVEPVVPAPTTVWVGGYWYYHENVRVWYPGRFIYRPHFHVERIEIHRHYRR